MLFSLYLESCQLRRKSFTDPKGITVVIKRSNCKKLANFRTHAADDRVFLAENRRNVLGGDDGQLGGGASDLLAGVQRVVVGGLHGELQAKRKSS